MAAPDFSYGALLGAQARGGYRGQPMDARSAFDTQNWASLAAQSSSSAASRDAAVIGAAANTAQQGISAFAGMSNQIVDSYGRLSQQALVTTLDNKKADAAIEAEKARRSGAQMGAFLGMGASVAGMFMDPGRNRKKPAASSTLPTTGK